MGIPGQYREMNHSPILFYNLDLQIGPFFPWNTVMEDSSSQPQSLRAGEDVKECRQG